LHGIRLAELFLRFQVFETTNYDGVLKWISLDGDYERHNNDIPSHSSVNHFTFTEQVVQGIAEQY